MTMEVCLYVRNVCMYVRMLGCMFFLYVSETEHFPLLYYLYCRWLVGLFFLDWLLFW